MNILDVYDMYKEYEMRWTEYEDGTEVYGDFVDDPDETIEIKLDKNGIVRTIKTIRDYNWKGTDITTETVNYDENGNKIGSHYKSNRTEERLGRNDEVLYKETIIGDDELEGYEIFEKQENGNLIYSIKASNNVPYVNSEVIISRATMFETSFYDKITGEKISEEEFMEKYPEYNFSRFNVLYPEYKELRKIQIEKINSTLLSLIEEDKELDSSIERTREEVDRKLKQNNFEEK